MELYNVIKVIALDPGGATGWAKGLIHEGKMGISSGQNEWNHSDLWHELNLMKPDIIVCERFEFRKGSSQQGAELISREYIGVVNLYVQLREAEEWVRAAYDKHGNRIKLYMQMPAEALGGIYKTDESLKKENLHKPGKPHANDAVRHLLYWFNFKEGYQFNEHGVYPLEGTSKLFPKKEGK